MVTSLNVANALVRRHGKDLELTNLSINKLVYFAQVEALKDNPSCPLFSDVVEAWRYGPVEPAVYRALKRFGRGRVEVAPTAHRLTDSEKDRVNSYADKVAEKYGTLMAFDLVTLSHKPGGAWRKAYRDGMNVRISPDDIKRSTDFTEEPDMSRTFGASVKWVEERYPNALRMLEDS